MPDCVLLTGATGLLGQCLLPILVQHGYRVRVLSRQPPSVINHVEWCQGDLRVADDCARAVVDAQWIIHAAGAKRHASDVFSVNVDGTANLIQSAITSRVGRFVHISSVGVIGANVLAEHHYSEDSACLPRNPYEKSKWRAEQLVREARFPATIIRPGNVIGARQKQGGLLALIRHVQNRRFVYWGGNQTTCNYVFAEDVAHACVAALASPAAVGRTYHVVDSCRLPELVEAIADQLHIPAPLRQVPHQLTYLSRTVLEQLWRARVLPRTATFQRIISLHSRASFATTRLLDELGFRLPIGWRRGLNRLIDFYRALDLI